MQNMDNKKLQLILTNLENTLSHKDELRKSAENFLTINACSETFTKYLLMITNQKQVKNEVKQSAVVLLKNIIHDFWNPKDGKTITQKDKSLIKGSLLSALINTADQKQISVQYQQIIALLLKFDYPDQWGEFYPLVIKSLNNSKGDFKTIIGCLQALKMLFKKYEHEILEKRMPLELLCKSTMPCLEGLMTQFMKNYNKNTAQPIKIIFEIYLTVIKFKLPEYFHDQMKMKIWMINFKTIFMVKMENNLLKKPANLNQKEQLESNIFWKVKSLIVQILFNWIQRNANIKYKEKNENLSPYETFHKMFAVPFAEDFYKMVQTYHSQFVTREVYYYCLKYLDFALQTKKTFAFLNSAENNSNQTRIDNIVFNYLIPQFEYTKEDQEAWNNCPKQYMLRDNYEADIQNEPRSIASSMLRNTITYQPLNMLRKILNYVCGYLKNGKDPKNQKISLTTIKKECLIRILCVLWEEINDSGELIQNMEHIMEFYVTSELSNQTPNMGFMKYRACHFFDCFGQIEFQNNKNIINICGGIFKCIQDKEIPVQAMAAIALNQIVEQDVAVQCLKQNLQVILQNYIKIMKNLECDKVVQSLQQFILTFGDQVSVYAFEIVKELTFTFFQKTQDDNGNSNLCSTDDNKKQANNAAYECLLAIEKIISAPLSVDIYAKILDQVLPIFQVILQEEAPEDFIQEALSILNIILYKLRNVKQIPQKLWHFFPILCYCLGAVKNQNQQFLQKSQQSIQNSGIDPKFIQSTFKGWARQHLVVMTGALNNFIQRKEFFQISDFFGDVYPKVLMNTVKNLVAQGLQLNDEHQCSLAMGLYSTLIENKKGTIDQVIPIILSECWGWLTIQKQQKTSNRGKILLLPSQYFDASVLQVIGMCLYYNAKITLNYFEQGNMTSKLFQMWNGHLDQFTSEEQKQRLLFAWTSILTIPHNQIPQVLQQNSMVHMIKSMIKVSGQILDHRISQYGEALCDDDNQNQQNNDQWQDDEDDEEWDEDFETHEESTLLYDSPLSQQCGILYLKFSLENMQKNQKQIFDFIMNGLSQEQKGNLQNYWKQAQQDQNEKVNLMNQQNQQQQQVQ